MKELKVITCNLLTDRLVLHDNPKFSIRVKNIESMIHQYEPDIICVQELTETMLPFMNGILNQYEIAGEYRHSYCSNEGNMILFKKNRFVHNRTKTLWLSNTPLHRGSKFLFSQFPRITTYVSLHDRLTNQSITVFNTHLDALFNFVRKQQLETLMKLIQQYSNSTFTILCGDFNTTSSTIQLITNAYFKDIVPDSIGSTLRGKHGSKRYHNQPIDHILISKEQNVSYTVFKITDSYNNVYPSDHYPLISTISF